MRTPPPSQALAAPKSQAFVWPVLLALLWLLQAGVAYGQSAEAIVGGWAYTPAGSNSANTVFTFFSNGTYYQAEGDHPDPIGTHQRGMERGTYTWNPSTGGFSSTTIEDTNGDWGLSDGTATNVTVVGDTLTFLTSEGTFSLSRVTSATNPLVGSWYADSGNAVFTFLSDGTYFEAEKNHNDPVGTHQPGMERGTYTWNPGTGAFSFITLEDSNGDWGLSDSGIVNLTVAGNVLSIGGAAAATRVVAALVITSEPRSQSVAVGGTGGLSVSATGSGTLAYQWFKDGVAIAGATANTLPRANATAADTGLYQVEVTNAGGSSRSGEAYFIVLPDGGTPFAGSDNFDGPHDPARWASTNLGFAGSQVRTSGRLEFRNSRLEDSGGGWVWNRLAPYGQDWEARVTGDLPALSFTADGYVGFGLYVVNSADPGDQAGLELETGRAGGNGYRQFASLFSVNDVDMPAQDVAAQTTSTRATFRVRWVAATARLHWEYDADGPANGEVWTLLRTFDPAATWGMSSGPFLIGIGGFSENRIVTSGDGVSLDDFAASTAAPAPTINTPPQSQVAIATSNVTFTVSATGSGLTYQWRKGGVDIGGATSDTLTLNSVTRAASGAYSVVVTSGGSSTPSSDATLRVIVPQRLQPPQRAGGGQFQLLFADPDNAVGGDLSRFEVHHTANFLGASTVWVTNSGSFTLSNGKILFDDAGSTSAPRRYYRVIEK